MVQLFTWLCKIVLQLLRDLGSRKLYRAYMCDNMVFYVVVVYGFELYSLIYEKAVRDVNYRNDIHMDVKYRRGTWFWALACKSFLLATWTRICIYPGQQVYLVDAVRICSLTGDFHFDGLSFMATAKRCPKSSFSFQPQTSLKQAQLPSE